MEKYLLSIVKPLLLYIIFLVGFLIGVIFSETLAARLCFGACAMVIILKIVSDCGRVLLVPCDLLVGKVTRNMQFSKTVMYESCGKHGVCPVWKFYYGADQKINLLLPVLTPMGEWDKTNCPSADQKVVVTYYRLSRLICEWSTGE